MRRSLRGFLGLDLSSQLLELGATDYPAPTAPKTGEGVWKAALQTLLDGFDPAFQFSSAKCKRYYGRLFDDFNLGCSKSSQRSLKDYNVVMPIWDVFFFFTGCSS